MKNLIFLMTMLISLSSCDLEEQNFEEQETFRDASIISNGQMTFGKAVNVTPYFIEVYDPFQELVFKLNTDTGYILGPERVYFEMAGCSGDMYYPISDINFCPALSPNRHVLFTDSDMFGVTFPFKSFESTGAPLILPAGGSYLEDGQCFPQWEDLCVLNVFQSANSPKWTTPIELNF